MDDKEYLRTIIHQPLPVKPVSDPEAFMQQTTSLVDSDPEQLCAKAQAWDVYVADIQLSMALLDKFPDHRESETGIAVLAAATRIGLLCERYGLESPF
jgi:hypothetical protein